MRKLTIAIPVFAGMIFLNTSASTQTSSQRLQLDRGGETIVLDPYAANILRVTLSLNPNPALTAPGYGFAASPESAGWSASQSDEADLYSSPRIVASVERNRPSAAPPLQTQVDIGKYFGGSTPGAHITLRTPSGKTLLELTGWQQAVPNQKDGTAELVQDRRFSDPPSFVVGATFASPDDEHYYGLGQNQEGFLDLRGHVIRCWNDYLAPAGQSTCVPFLITNKGYGLVWDNPSKTTVELGFNEQTRWTSQAGNRVSFFVIVGDTPDEIYAGYRLLTGSTPVSYTHLDVYKRQV